ncbi:general transcription factor II-I repeat domain-containing protein 2B-like [Embiotoca jacksoni]|uniref:general transcription factor II-I repeat domain-containing protein 2B-like n=1 Tax=Embiotoca jacksoni TaxID=100190 RepID=UPI0037047A5C
MDTLGLNGTDCLTGKNVGLLKRTQDKVTEIDPDQKLVFLHCIIHQHVLCKSVLKMNHVIDVVTKIVNFIRAPLNHRQFVSLLEEHETEHSDIGYHTAVRWLGKMLKRLWELKAEIREFCKKKGKDIPELSGEDWMAGFAFAVDVTALMNELNTKLQGEGLFVHEMHSLVKAFMRKLQFLSSQLDSNNLTHMQTLKEVTPSADHFRRYSSKLGALHDFCELELDTHSVNRRMSDNNRKVTVVEEDQSYPDHPDRSDRWWQLLCRTGLTGRCYWEVEWREEVHMAVSYRGIRRGKSNDCWFGGNDRSWSLRCYDGGYYVWHNDKETTISSSSVSNRVAVYVDCPAGTLSFYRVSSDTLIHLHTFNTTFTEPLYPGFGFASYDSSVSLCSL